MTVARLALREMGIKRPQIEYGRDGRTIETLVAARRRRKIPIFEKTHRRSLLC